MKYPVRPEGTQSFMQNGNGRLSSWKEIAAHFGKNVRTVQRWEAQLGLPVHRVAGKKRDLVFAYEHELDAWMRSSRNALSDPAEKLLENKEASQAADPAANGGGNGIEPEAAAVTIHHDARIVATRWFDRRAVAAAGLLIVLLAASSYFLWAPAWRNGPPTGWRVDANRLWVTDAEGRDLWHHTFARPVDTGGYSRPRDPGKPPLVQIVDLENDGQSEVLFTHLAPSFEMPSFYCFNSDGTLRFSRRPGRPVRFGERDFDGGFVTQFPLVTANANGTKTIWLAGIHFWSPSVLEKLSPQGELLGEFWHGGHIASIQEGTHQGRRVILAGYVRNENHGASLAVIDYENPSGSAPAETDAYTCRTCPEGGPLAFFTFPQMELSRAIKSMPFVELIRQAANGETTVTVRQTNYFPTPDQPAQAIVIYTLDPNLEVIAGKIPIAYEQVHAQFEASGRINHRYSPAEGKELFPVRKWADGRVTTVSAPFAQAEPLITRRSTTAGAPAN